MRTPGPPGGLTFKGVLIHNQQTVDLNLLPKGDLVGRSAAGEQLAGAHAAGESLQGERENGKRWRDERQADRRIGWMDQRIDR